MNNDSRKIWENIFQLSQAVFRVTHLFPKDEILKRHLREKITEILYQSSRHSDSPAGGEASKKYENLIKEIHNFRSYLFTAKNCNFVDEKNLIILIKECENLLEKLDKFSRDLTSSIQKAESHIIPEIPAPVIAIPRQAEKQSQLHQFHVGSMSFPPAVAGKPRRESRPLQTNNYKSQTDQPTQPDIGFFVPNIRQQKIIDYFKKNNKEKIRLKDVADEFRNITPRTVRSDLRELCDNGHLVRNGNGAGSFYHLPNNAS